MSNPSEQCHTCISIPPILPLNYYVNCPIAEIRQRSEELIIMTETNLKTEKSSAEDKLTNPNLDMAQAYMYTALD